MTIAPLNAYTMLQNAKNEIKNLGNNPSAQAYKKIKELASQARIAAEQELQDSYNNKPFKKKVDKFLEKIFEKFAKAFRFVPKNKGGDLSKTIISIFKVFYNLY